MEHINKEQLAEESAQEYASRFYDYTNSDRKWDASKVNYQNGYLAGFNQAEEIYSKKLEEKDNKIIKIAQNLANLQDDLGKAKELLKEASKELNYYGDGSEDEFDIKEMTEKIKNFLNK